MENKSVFQVDVTKDGNAYPDRIIIDVDKDVIFKKELSKLNKIYPNDYDLGKAVRKLMNND
jgi:hypothetical protein